MEPALPRNRPLNDATPPGSQWCLDGVFGCLARLAARVAALRFRLMINVVCVGGSHTHEMEKRSMKHYAGLDVSVKEASVCIEAEAGGARHKMSVTLPDSMPVLASFIRPSPSPDFTNNAIVCR
jgi:hypothetical protein